MESDKLSKLLAEKGKFNGGFRGLTTCQLDKLKGGSMTVPPTEPWGSNKNCRCDKF